jgi:hypothetical protein
VVTQAGSATTFAVSAIAPGASNALVVLTLAEMGAAGTSGVVVTYAAGGNGTVTDVPSNALATDSTGVSIAAWATGRPSLVQTPTTTTPTVLAPPTTVTVGLGQTVITTLAETGTTAAISFGGSLGFSIGGASHSVRVGNVNAFAGIATITLNSTPIDLDLKVGETKQVDLDGDGVKDVEVTLVEIISDNDLKILIKPLLVATVVIPEAEVPVVIPVSTVVENNGAYLTGRWVKTAKSAAVYFLDSNNVRHAYFSQPIWQSYFGNDFSRVETISAMELSSYDLGVNVPFNAGTLVKATTSSRVYKVDAFGNLIWVSSEATAIVNFGTDWAKQVKDLSDAIFVNYKIVGTL